MYCTVCGSLNHLEVYELYCLWCSNSHWGLCTVLSVVLSLTLRSVYCTGCGSQSVVHLLTMRSMYYTLLFSNPPWGMCTVLYCTVLWHCLRFSNSPWGLCTVLSVVLTVVLGLLSETDHNVSRLIWIEDSVLAPAPVYEHTSCFQTAIFNIQETIPTKPNTQMTNQF